MLLRRGFVRWHACYAACMKPLQRWAIDERQPISAALVRSLLPSAAVLPWCQHVWKACRNLFTAFTSTVTGLGGRYMQVSTAFLSQEWHPARCTCQQTIRNFAALGSSA